MLAARASIAAVGVIGLVALVAVLATSDRVEAEQIVLEAPVMDAPEITYRTSTVTMTEDDEIALRRAIEAIVAGEQGSQPRIGAPFGVLD